MQLDVSRVQKELVEIEKDKVLSGVSVSVCGDELSLMRGTIVGPVGTPYEGGTFVVDIQLPSAYPFEPPKMHFVTKVWHPNISSQNGAICLDILKDQWSPALTLKTALLSLQALLSSPEPDDPQDAVVARQYLRDHKTFVSTARHWTETFATRASVGMKEKVAMGQQAARITEEGDDNVNDCEQNGKAVDAKGQGSGSMALASSTCSSSEANTLFDGLVVCVTGLSKDARRWVQRETERLGGQYSPALHPRCTHLLVQSMAGRKFQHACKHGAKKGLQMVTLRWLLDSVKRNARMDESKYPVTVKTIQDVKCNWGQSRDAGGLSSGEDCLSAPSSRASGSDGNRQSRNASLEQVDLPEYDRVRDGSSDGQDRTDLFDGFCFYVDADVPEDVQQKVKETIARGGGSETGWWYVGCRATHVVCEAEALYRYAARSVNVVTPLWVLRSMKSKVLLNQVQFSADLGMHLASVLHSRAQEANHAGNGECRADEGKRGANGTYGREVEMPPLRREREQEVQIAKAGVRRRRGPRKQPCRTLPRPITPALLMETVCWAVTDLPTTAKTFRECDESSEYIEFSMTRIEALGIGSEGSIGDPAADFSLDSELTNNSPAWGLVGNGVKKDATRIMDDFGKVRSMLESERMEVVFPSPFLTILFPIDRFAEMGLSSRQFFSEAGFTRHQILEAIYSFYQEGMSTEEVRVALHTDSKYADRLRAAYVGPLVTDCLPVKDQQKHVAPVMKRCEFLGSRRSFEGLQRTGRDNTGNVYELLLGV
ncbi:hypothetical protein CBR_g17947 [Chara braunii]|uniref:E2 ubiquitin-conjugating enzyme n=1 Tax=Chara braunii TaxID=69332 RepID=A0A388KW15_CHABU|nr:hypothetical protein CBR_g17947 [Chara braunii]|eukprot:GBG74237.1 hypothetical protein CBR_g17947 [Chara braunii]